MPLVGRCFRERLPLGDDVHRGIMDVFRQYMVVGGMPQAVRTFVETRDLEEVDLVKRDILQLYRADIRKFGGVVRHKALAVFNAIPSQLSKHEKRIVLAEIRSGAKMRDFDSTFEWLKSAICESVPKVRRGRRRGVRARRSEDDLYRRGVCCLSLILRKLPRVE